MKIAVSIPDPVFKQAEALVEESGSSRSSLYARALEEFVARHAPDRVTEAMDLAVDLAGNEDPGFRRRAAKRAAERNAW